MSALPPLEIALARAFEILAAASPERREAFELRLRRRWLDLVEPLGSLYGQAADEVAVRLVERAAAAYIDRDPALHRLDQQRILEPDWLQQPRMFGDGRRRGMLESHGDRHRRPRRHPPEREHDAGSHGLDDLAR